MIGKQVQLFENDCPVHAVSREKAGYRARPPLEVQKALLAEKQATIIVVGQIDYQPPRPNLNGYRKD